MKEQIFKEAIEFYGTNYQTDIAIEEMCELSKALFKFRRNPTDENLHNIIEELADLYIVTEQVKMMYLTTEEDHQLFKEISYCKIARLKLRIDKDKEQKDLQEQFFVTP